MANYPSADPSFTTKQDGVDYPQAAHVNDLQAEVTAIGAALRGTLAHAVTASGLSISGPSTVAALQGGASTLASLQVAGPSTFAGAVTFAAGISVSAFADPITLSSGAVVSTGVIRQNALPAWDVYHSTHVAMGANSTLGASFDTQEFVRGDIGHSTGVNSSRVTITSTGLYAISARSVVHSNSNPTNRGAVVLNDSVRVLESQYSVLGGGANSSRVTVQVSGLVRMQSTGYLTFQLMSENGAVSTHGSSSPFLATRFQGWFVG